ncbi:hypothetical protein AB205_0207430 [Aquarana catesbeiana]|uniref:Uncharacterized protein n=1 Tax=Aquarana catesbeiana TaxID=8400 RepID=A0A2G9SD13_AQUCT|nr:hypothetical protein AB205_0207430 [Aquarana catesbeiana]
MPAGLGIILGIILKKPEATSISLDINRAIGKAFYHTDLGACYSALCGRNGCCRCVTLIPKMLRNRRSQKWSMPSSASSFIML